MFPLTPLSLQLSSQLSTSRPGDEVFKRSDFEDMRQSAASSSGMDYIIWSCGGEGKRTYTEEELANTIHSLNAWKQQHEKKSKNKQALSDVHNLNVKALTYMFREFHTSVLTRLPVGKQQLVTGCASFADFHEAVNNLGNGTPNYNIIVNATDDFCEKYGAKKFFWRQAVSLRGLNRDRNEIEHRSVHECAAAINEALDRLDELEVLKPAAVMLDALALFSMHNAQMIDKEAEQERKETEKMLGDWRTEARKQVQR